MLKNGIHWPLIWRQILNFLVKQLDPSRGYILKPSDHPQQGGLSTAGWPQQCQKFVVEDLQRNIVNGLNSAIAFALNFGYA
jgi:hypothetical protein